MIRAAAILVALAAAPCPAHAEETLRTCAPDAQIMMLQDYATFDQSPRGWRAVDRPGCEAVTADLIARFRDFQKNLLAAPEVQMLRWHEGQVRAGLGESAAAIALIEGAHDPDGADPWRSGWNPYVDATLAFLKHDRAALDAARAALAASPKPADFDAMAAQYAQQTGRTALWPPNLDVVDSLMRCFERSYREAYASAECRG